MQLAQHRHELGLSQNAVAARSGLAQGHISQYESGKRTPRLAAVMAYAAAVGLQVTLPPAEGADRG
ncbi:helix-turn-helix transcriptional regulator [Streptosporangium canum]|uniref:helix-turn-helix domain-containing protein n=1 Tax=Streptosporangium canum TaxID=324952 RepID=UPI0034371675